MLRVIEIEDTGVDSAIVQNAKENIGEDDQRRAQVIEIIREWLKKQPHLTFPLDDRYILIYARGCKYSLEKIKRKIDLTLTLKALMPEFFSDWDPLKPGLQKVLNYGLLLPLPGYDNLGRKVMIYRYGCVPPPDECSAEDVEKACAMIGELVGYEEPLMFITGGVVIVDFKGFTLNHITYRPMSLIKKQTKFMQEAGPASPKSLIMFNTSHAFTTFYNLVSTLVNEKMKQRIKICGSELESLQKEVPKSILPSDYGGDGPSVEELTACWKKKLEDNREFLMKSSTYKADESKRPGKPKTVEDILGIEGSFRKLNID